MPLLCREMTGDVSETCVSRGICATYGLCDIVDDDGAVCISVVHGRQTLISFLSCCVPDLELDCSRFIESNGLCEKCCADCGFAVIVELVLRADRYGNAGQLFFMRTHFDETKDK